MYAFQYLIVQEKRKNTQLKINCNCHDSAIADYCQTSAYCRINEM